MNLSRDQLTELDQLASKARTLADAKQAVREATADIQTGVYTALDAGVPLSRVAEAAGVARSLIYHWIDRIEDE